MQEYIPNKFNMLNQNALQLFANGNGILANRVSYVFDLKGPSLITDTMCSSSGTAFVLAINDLQLGNLFVIHSQ